MKFMPQQNFYTRSALYAFLFIFICSLFTITGSALAAVSPLAGGVFYVNPATNFAAQQEKTWAITRPADALQMKKISQQPKAFWMGNWTPNSQQAAADYTSRAAAAGKVGVITAYNIPNRDCGSYSAGGAQSYTNYKSWINGLAAGIGNRKTVVILEPDALAQLKCLDAPGQNARTDALTYAVTKLKNSSSAIVYLDAGNKGWLSAADAAARLKQANISQADGFALNVSNFYTNSESITYGNDLSSRVGGKHYIIDTSRNGLGSNGQWCNPSGRALGTAPTTNTGSGLVDAFIWVKGPGESDGTCNGGPAAGSWWAEYALALAKNSYKTNAAATTNQPTGTNTNSPAASATSITSPNGNHGPAAAIKLHNIQLTSQERYKQPNHPVKESVFSHIKRAATITAAPLTAFSIFGAISKYKVF
jgi:endoglucanase